MRPHRTMIMALCICVGGLGGWVLSAFPVPLPFLLGGLLVNSTLVALLPRDWMKGVRLPDRVRVPFICIVGMMIGAQVQLERIVAWPAVLGLLAVVTIFVVLAYAINWIFFRKIARYDAPTALFAAAPGGLIEALTLGETAGGDPARLMLQHFLRIIFVVTLLPMAISLWVGHPVGSASGLQLSGAGSQSPYWVIAVIGAAGILMGNVLRLPAKQLTGPMMAAGLVASTGWVPLVLPNWLMIVAQVVIGAGLGLRFNGISRQVLRQGAAMSLLSTLVLMMLGACFAAVLHLASPLPWQALVLSFAPGGVTEMSLVALSLAADPAIVTLAHVYRISLTVVIMGILGPRLLGTQA